MSSTQSESCCCPICCLLCFRGSKDDGETVGTPCSVAMAVEERPINGKACADVMVAEYRKEEAAVKGSLKKPKMGDECDASAKRNVRWMDLLGKELVEVKEFEPSESGDSQDGVGASSSCGCAIQ